MPSVGVGLGQIIQLPGAGEALRHIHRRECGAGVAYVKPLCCERIRQEKMQRCAGFLYITAPRHSVVL
jgi:hypothetical protein